MTMPTAVARRQRGLQGRHLRAGLARAGGPRRGGGTGAGAPLQHGRAGGGRAVCVDPFDFELDFLTDLTTVPTLPYLGGGRAGGANGEFDGQMPRPLCVEAGGVGCRRVGVDGWPERAGPAGSRCELKLLVSCSKRQADRKTDVCCGSTERDSQCLRSVVYIRRS